MPTSHKIYQLALGTPASTSLGVTFLGIGSAGERRASRRLVHPDSDLAPITYFSNPDKVFGLDKEVLWHPLTSAVRTIGSTKVVRFEQAAEDVLIEEVWLGGQARASMPTFFFRQLYEYLINEPTFDPIAQEFILWEPRDRSDKVYEVELLSLTAGEVSPQDNRFFDVADIRPSGGLFDAERPGDYAGALDTLNELETGVLDSEVRLTMKIVGEVLS